MMCVVAKSFLCTYLLGVFQGGYDNTFRASYKFTTLAAWLSHVKIMAGLTSPVCSNLLEFLGSWTTHVQKCHRHTFYPLLFQVNEPRSERRICLHLWQVGWKHQQLKKLERVEKGFRPHPQIILPLIPITITIHQQPSSILHFGHCNLQRIVPSTVPQH